MAPSTELRKWYGHDPAKFDEFRARYTAELDAGGEQAVITSIAALPEALRGRSGTRITRTGA